MIVVDLEMTGMDYERCGIVEIGAIDTDSLEEFYGEARLAENNQIINEGNCDYTVQDVLGKTEAELREKTKQSEKQLLEKFFNWCKNAKVKNFICQHPHSDIAFLEQKARIHKIKFPFLSYKAFDMHSMAQVRFFLLNKEFSLKSKQGELQSAMGLPNILELVGMKDKRKINHNALEDAKLTAEAFSRLIYGKNLLKEYSEFSVPDYLK